MSKRLTFKSTLSLIVILFTAFFLVACGDTDQDLVDAALSDVALVFATGDSATSVTQNLSLPTTVGETITITWSSDKTEVISNAGVVVRPAVGQPDSTVVLTGTLTMGDATATKAFTLIVKAMVLTDQQVVDAAVPNLAITYAGGDSATSVTTDLVLPTTVGTVTVTWSSNTTAVVSNAGVVVRPAKGAADATVVLTATLTKGTATATKTFTLTVHALQYTNQDLVDAAVTALAVGYATGDTVDTITADLTLAALSGTVAITWASDTPAVISDAGVVVRPAKGEADATVVLTATLTLGAVEETKTFTLTVLAIPYTEEDAATALDISGTDLVYNTELNRYTTTSDITLPATSLGFAIVWTSGNTTFIGIDGTVVRPAYGETDSTVILTATIGDETKEFIVTVLAITVKPASLILSEASDALLLPGVGDGVAADLTLPAVVGTEGVTVTWTSGNTNIITDAGLVTRPLDGNVTVTLTATLHLGDQSVTKEFDVVVLTYAPFTAVADIAAAIASVEGTYVEIPDVTVVGLFSTGYMIYDGTTLLQVYKTPTDLEVGDVFTIRGVITNYYGSMEIVGNSNMPIVYIESSATAAVLTPTVFTGSITEYIATLPAYPLTAPLTYQYVQLTAQVQVDDPLANYETFLVDTDFSGTDINSSGTGAFIMNALMIYYPSNIAAVRAYDGLDVTLNVFLFAQRTNNKIYTVIFTGVEDDISVVPLTDVELVDFAKTSVVSTFKSEYVLPQTITLPTEIEGVTITWASDNVLFDVTTGALTMPVTGQEDVTVTATLSKGDATGEQVVTFKAGDKPVQTIAEAILVESGELVHVVGVITASQYYRTFFIQDATGGIAIYTSNAAFITFLTTNYGKEVDLVGTRAAYNGLNQISNVVINTLVGDATMPIATNVDAAGLDSDALAMYQGQLVEFTGLAVTAVNTDNYGNVTLSLYDASSNKYVTMKWDSRVTLSTLAAATLAGIAVNDVLDVVTPLAWSNGPYLYFTDSTVITQVVLTDAERVALAKAAVIGYFADEYNEETTLSPSTSLFGATIVYDTASTFFDVVTGAVTIPAVGRETVSVTATITLGTETDTATIEFVVGIPLISVLYTTADATIVTVQGIVVAGEYYNTFFIQDSSGAVAIYTSNATFSADLLVGNLVEVTGELDFYSGLVEVKPSAVTVLATGQTLPAVLDIESYNLVGLLDMQSQNVSLMELVVTNVAVDSYGNITLTLLDVSSDVSVQMKWDSRQTLTTEAQAQIDAVALGDVIDLVTTLGWKNGPYLFYTNTSIITEVVTPSAAALLAVDQTFADADAAALSIPELLLDAAPITANMPALGANGSTIVWATDNATIITTAGTVTLPTVGQETVTLTATLTLGAATTEVVFIVVVGVPEVVAEPTLDLFISEYIEGTPGNRKAIEIYNPTSETVVLTGVYTLALNVNANTIWATAITLTGSIAAGDVFVVYYDDSTGNDKLAPFGDYETSSLSFNGDDAVGLFKNAVLLDMFGVFGEDPGDGWTMDSVTNATKDHVITRNSSVLFPSDVWNISEWTVGAVYVDGTVTTLGSHTVAIASDLFISEYIEGTSSNRAIEIYNGTGLTVDLTGYTLELFKGGSTTASDVYTLTGTLAHGEVFVLTNTAANSAILAVADDTVEYPNIPFFTGDDAITLSKDGVVIDMFGVVGTDPGDFWVVGTGATQDYTLVRKASVLAPSATWDVNEWDVYAVDTFTYIGSHTVS